MPRANINGVGIHYEDIGSGDVLVMLHGANNSGRSFEEHFGDLGSHFRLIVPDIRSGGQSDHVASLPSPSAWVDDLAALLDHLGIERAHIYGTSLGSRIGMRFAMEHPERTKSLIITAPHTYLTHELDSNMNKVAGDGTKLPPEEQARQQRLHGDDWLNAYRNYYNIRNQPDLQKYYNLRVTSPLHDVIGEYSDSVNRIACQIMVIQGDEIGNGRGTYDHAIELKNEMPNQVRLAIVPSFDGGRVPAETLRSLLKQFVAYVSTPSAVPAGAAD